MVYVTDFILNAWLFVGETAWDFFVWVVAVWMLVYFIAAEVLGVSVYSIIGGQYIWRKLGSCKPQKRKDKKQDMFYEDA